MDTNNAPFIRQEKVVVTLSKLLPTDSFDKMGWYAVIAMSSRESAYEAFKDIGNQHPAFGDLSSQLFEYYYVRDVNGIEIGRFTLRRIDDKTYNFGSFSIYPQYRTRGYATAVISQLLTLHPECKFELFTNSSHIMQVMVKLGWSRVGFIKDDYTENALFKYVCDVYFEHKGRVTCS